MEGGSRRASPTVALPPRLPCARHVPSIEASVPGFTWDDLVSHWAASCGSLAALALDLSLAEGLGTDLTSVERALRRLRARGRVACPSCGEEIIVAFSRKCRGASPSCAARRMCGSAAHLVDRALPDVAMRQWVLTAPNEVRRVLALRPDALTAQNRIFVEEIARW